MHLSSASFFDPILESEHQAVVVVDQDGMVLTANSLGKKAVPGFEKAPYASKSLGEYLKNKKDLPMLLEDTSGKATEECVAFKSNGRGKGLCMKPLRRKKVELMNGTEHRILVFEAVPEQEAEDGPLLRSGAYSSDYIGSSPQWKKVDELVKNVAAHRSNVMIMGDTGTGKEVVARALHRLSGRSGEFVAINCGALPRDLLASELFGYEGGAFTGARSSGAKGKFEYANGGTLFLDEIGDMPLDMQVSLLRVLQEQSVLRIGSNKPIPINVRIIAATNRNLQKLIAAGKFRSDLWYRLSVIEIYLPRLRDREGDVPLLAEYFNESLSRSLNIQCHPLSPEVLDFMDRYRWPGNVRELKNVMEKALIMSNGEPLTVENFPEYMRRELRPAMAAPAFEAEEEPEREVQPKKPRPAPAEKKREKEPEQALTPRQLRERKEREKIVRVLEEERGNISRSAKRLNISRNTLYRKIEKMDIQIRVSAVTDEEE